MTAPAAPAQRPVTRVAVGVLLRGDGAVLMADRPAGKPYAGYWEFPGGKIEYGESVDQALAREFAEELGLQVHASLPWTVLEHDYPHAYVRLYFRRIVDWSGEPHAREGQRLHFHRPGEPAPAPLLPAAVPALRWAGLPTMCGQSPGTMVTAAGALQWLESMLGRGLRLVVWHEPRLSAEQRRAAMAPAEDRARAYGARVLFDARDLAAAGHAGRDAFLERAALNGAARRPAVDLLGARVQTTADLARAAALGCDFAILAAGDGPSPVAAAERACADCPLPVYLPGDGDLATLQRAQAFGAHGLAVRYPQDDRAPDVPC